MSGDKNRTIKLCMISYVLHMEREVAIANIDGKLCKAPLHQNFLNFCYLKLVKKLLIRIFISKLILV